jgi:proteasome lid subunit RPN8/RPN11
MREHAVACFPEEACGILGGLGEDVQEVIPITNFLHSSFRFQMDPEEQLKALLGLEERGLEMIGYYHSHPKGPTEPSITDIQMHYYPGTAVVILSNEKQWETNVYLIEGTTTRQIPINFV